MNNFLYYIFNQPVILVGLISLFLKCCLTIFHAGVLQRWRHLQSQAIRKDEQLKENVRQWAQFRCDVTNILVWLGDAEAIQMTQSTVPTQLRDIEIAVRRHQVGRRRWNYADIC